ncbi:hypothetical protein MAIT1_05194 [Magnetofaba australis IT-1]|uniref:Uncharacterized protein n=2 Tax=Magnetofaba TaxID=1472292 RepID=A0A1Y2K6N4_9PROT|nr:hypothetical protein MAIT1_05194 [Magnetofaba australis IT-1]
MVNDHNGRIPRDFWLDDWERERLSPFSMNIRQRAIGA